MGQHEFEQKLAAAESSGARDRGLELLHYVRKEKLREPQAVARVGKLLVTKHSWGLGDECAFNRAETADMSLYYSCINALPCVRCTVWSVYEQTFVAALDLHDDELAEVATTCSALGVETLD
jgi:hypothetical protein